MMESTTNAANLQQSHQNSPSTSSATDIWADVDNAILRARSHLYHSKENLDNANALVQSLSDMLERIREEARANEGGGIPLLLNVEEIEQNEFDIDQMDMDEEEEEGDEGHGQPVFESMILCGSNGPSNLGRKRSIQHKMSSIANPILPLERKRSSAMNLKKRSMVAPAPLQGMSIVERKETHHHHHHHQPMNGPAEHKSSVYFLNGSIGANGNSSRRGTGCSTAKTNDEECWAATATAAAEADGQEDPTFLRSLPHLAIISSALLWLFLGALVFRWIDPSIGTKPFHRALLYSFELCTSIGWGDSHSSNAWSQAFCVVFTLFGIPVLFSAFANIGRLITEFYCVDWLFLSAIVRRKQSLSNPPHRRRFPLRLALNLLFLHQCLGVLLYSGLLRNFSVISTVYFSITSMATIGLGDFSPEPANWGETLIALVYFSSGIILLSALYLTISYHFQTFFYITLRQFLHNFYVRIWKRRGKGRNDEGSSREREERPNTF